MSKVSADPKWNATCIVRRDEVEGVAASALRRCCCGGDARSGERGDGAVAPAREPGPADGAGCRASGSSCRPVVAGLLAQGVQQLHEFAFDQAVAPFRAAATPTSIARWRTGERRWRTGAGSPAPAAARPWPRDGRVSTSPRSRHGRPRTVSSATWQQCELRYRHRVGDGAALYATAMHELATAFPDDAQAQLFSALAQVQLAESGRTGGTGQARSGPGDARRPRGPGQRSRPAALLASRRRSSGVRRPGPCTPAAALAARPDASAYLLHLPSHVFMRRGMWNEAISANLRSADAARRDGSADDELHALDALSYAYLQAGRIDEAVGHRARIAGGYLRHRRGAPADYSRVGDRGAGGARGRRLPDGRAPGRQRRHWPRSRAAPAGAGRWRRPLWRRRRRQRRRPAPSTASGSPGSRPTPGHGSPRVG